MEASRSKNNDGCSGRTPPSVSGFEPRKSLSFDTEEQQKPNAPLVRWHSIAVSSLLQHVLASKVQQLNDNGQLARQGYLELRQETSELREYSDVKLDRVMRYRAFSLTRRGN